MDTAAILENLDMLISCDSSVAHLAGALDRLVWLALPYSAEWRWMRGRADSPWYPRHRLFRQPRPRAWPDVFARIAAELASFPSFEQ
jgi:ADP-heptose:LPS heptosyltransferase